ncbi:hypothetical protein BCY88_27970 [Paraburkholderia fungorum]|uniref:Uncharacterized protein n=2 Tax=Paraburkholderia fungorum TaxID=134537 RepID=A0A3R7F7X4_9BURK|nr:hypothetical protein BCY88_27970 [Paraburkholderia fungorum]
MAALSSWMLYKQTNPSIQSTSKMHGRSYFASFALIALALLVSLVSPVRAQTGSADATSATAPVPASATRNEKILRQVGLLPGTSQYQIGDRWLNRLFSDPDVHRSFEISREAAQAAPDKPVPGMMDGLARATPQDRYDYFSLVAAIMDRSSLDQCVSLSDSDIMKWVAVSHLSDAEADTLFRVMFDARKALGQNLPKAQLTPEKIRKAMSLMGAELDREYPVGTPLRTRYRNAALHPDQASAADTCFVGQVGLHLMLALDPVSRDVMLLTSGVGVTPDGDALHDRPDH